MRSNTLLFFLAAFLTSCKPEPQKYTASECVVRINIDWVEKSEPEKQRVLIEFADFYIMQNDLRFNKIPPSMAVQGQYDEYIFLQYKFDCENRIENTQILLDRFLLGDDFKLNFVVDHRKFASTADTIKSRGEWWID